MIYFGSFWKNNFQKFWGALELPAPPPAMGLPAYRRVDNGGMYAKLSVISNDNLGPGVLLVL